MQKTDSKEKFKDLDTCLICDKPKLTLQNPLGPLMVVSFKTPVAVPIITPPHCHLALLQGQDITHFYHEFPSPKHFIIIFVIILRDLHSSGRSQSNVRPESTRPSYDPAVLVPLFRYEGATSVICLTLTLQNYFLILL